MAKTKRIHVGLILFVLVLGAGPAWGAAKYSSKTITFVAPSGAGGAFDVETIRFS